ncbi:hypothetical protein D5086_017706 [Populus alba]|uniref:Uncharacterized protein n=2 Tax=Populus TaxID=3689 RepID=A0ACC4BP09_POPAL|nr:hypothetical protein POTOM_034018 [Populus tomentosa]
MGRKIGGLFFNPKKRRIAAKPCMQEMISFLSCLSQNQMNDERCLHSKELLKTCLDDETAKSKKKGGSMNYHLQRLNKKMKTVGYSSAVYPNFYSENAFLEIVVL